MRNVLLVALTSFLCACGGGGGGEDAGGILAAIFGPDTTPPTIVSTSPVNNATGVALNAVVSVTASEAIDPATLTNATFTVTLVGGPAVPGTISVSGNTATFTPVFDFAATSQYIASVSTGVKDTAGNESILELSETNSR